MRGLISAPNGGCTRMDIKAAQADRFLKSPPPEIAAVLFYGTDPGLVSERASVFAKALADDKKSPGEIIRLDDSDLSGDPDRLGVELRTIPMFGGRKIVRLRAEARLKPELITDLIDGSPLAGVLVVEGGNLKPDSKLRAVFVGAANAAAVACFPDDERSLAGLVNEVSTEYSLAMPQAVRDHLVSLLGADRTLSRGEVEKLALYVGPNAAVTIEDVDAIVGDASELGLDQIAHAVAAGKTELALTTSDRAVASGESPQSIILALLRHFMRLHMLASAVAAGKPLDGALRSFRPPLHFKAQPLVFAEVRAWTLPRLTRAVALIQRAAKEARLSSLLERELAERLVVDLCRLAGERG